jgi:PKD repeat protein
VVVSVPPVVGEDPPRDPTGDGDYEDVDGSGAVDIFDVQALFTGLDTAPVQDHAGLFDFDGDGVVDVLDVQALFDELQSGAF